MVDSKHSLCSYTLTFCEKSIVAASALSVNFGFLNLSGSRLLWKSPDPFKIEEFHQSQNVADVFQAKFENQVRFLIW